MKTPQAIAKTAMHKLAENKSASVPIGEVRTILNTISQAPGAGVAEGAEGCRAPAVCPDLRRGDVFVAKAQGGKVRPWVVLRVNALGVIALAMSSGDSAPGMVRGKCRLWPGTWLGSTISAFTPDAAGAEVMRPYSNLRHLDEVEADLFNRLRSDPVTKIKSIAEIVKRRSA